LTVRATAALKRLEVAWRTVWIRALTRIMRRSRGARAPTWGSREHRVLFLRHDRIGDMILSTGLLRAIAKSHDTITLDVLASPANAPVLRGDPHVDTTIVFDRTKPTRYLSMLRRLRCMKYDAVIDCMPTAPSLTTLLLMWASGATHRIGVANRGNDDALTLPVAPNRDAVHVVDQLAALSAAFGVDRQRGDFRPRLYLDERERERAIATWEDDSTERARRLLVNVSAGRAFRRWPNERYVAVIRHALSRDARLRIVVIAAPDDRARAEAIARESAVRFVSTPSLRDALALVATSDLLFTPDTGVAHAASAFERPAVVMYIHGTARQWGLYESPGREISSPDASLLSLDLPPVLAALDEVLTDDVLTHRATVRSRAVEGGGAGRLVRYPTA
jgi:ADP-heptose:LPS heptosyltransferase